MEKTLKILMTCDGEQAIITASLYVLKKEVPPELKDQTIMLVKFAASASGTQQPNDVSPQFKVFKQAAKSDSPFAPADYTHRLRTDYLVDLDSASRETYARYLSRLPTLLSKAFHKENVTKG